MRVKNLKKSTWQSDLKALADLNPKKKKEEEKKERKKETYG